MDLTQLANLGEFIDGVAVLVTLIYLAVQVRQENQLGQAESARAIANTQRQVQVEFNRMHEITISNPVVLQMLCEVERRQELDSLEQRRFHWFANRLMNQWRAVETAYEHGSVERTYYDAIKEDVERACSDWPQLRDGLREMLGFYSKRWRIFFSIYRGEMNRKVIGVRGLVGDADPSGPG